MSIRTLLWAKDQAVVTATVRQKKLVEGGPSVTVESEPAPSAIDKLILIGVADEAADSTWDALIGNEDLAIFAMTTRRTVRESLSRLERAGYIRVRACKVESGASGWNRIYLLSPDSPLVKQQIEVDWGVPEVISRFQMRTYSRRDESSYVPSDARSRDKDAAQGQEEPGSPLPSTPNEGRGNLVPPTRGNQVPGEGEPGSSYEGEPGSPHLFSTGGTTPSIDARPRAEDEEGGKEPPEGPTSEATRLILGLVWGSHRRPTEEEVADLSGLIDAAVTPGRSYVDLKRHAQVSINGARPANEGGNAIAYLRNALTLYLPAPLVDQPSGAPPATLDSTPAAPETREAARHWKSLKPKPDAEPASAIFGKVLEQLAASRPR